MRNHFWTSDDEHNYRKIIGTEAVFARVNTLWLIAFLTGTAYYYKPTKEIHRKDVKGAKVKRKIEHYKKGLTQLETNG